jgi:ferredoxin
MPDKSNKTPNNVSGKFYVDNNCIGCGQCHSITPEHFCENSDLGVMFVCKQPSSADEVKLCHEAKDVCPVEAIGDDGDA